MEGLTRMRRTRDAVFEGKQMSDPRFVTSRSCRVPLPCFRLSRDLYLTARTRATGQCVATDPSRLSRARSEPCAALREIPDRAERQRDAASPPRHPRDSVAQRGSRSDGMRRLLFPSVGHDQSVTVLARWARGKRWEVAIDQREIERFSTLEEAVQAVDYEIARRGPAAQSSALDDAAWRYTPPSPELLRQVRAHDHPHTQAEALQLLVGRMTRAAAEPRSLSRMACATDSCRSGEINGQRRALLATSDRASTSDAREAAIHRAPAEPRT